VHRLAGARPHLRDLALHDPLQPGRRVEERLVEVLLHAADAERLRPRDPERQAALLIDAALLRPGVAEEDGQLGGGVVEEAGERRRHVLVEELRELRRERQVVGVDDELHAPNLDTPRATAQRALATLVPFAWTP
jgi:hypothetical protein